MQIFLNPPTDSWDELCKRPELENSALESSVTSILDAVKKFGDKAVREYTKQFDKVDIETLLVNQNEIIEANKIVSKKLKSAIAIASRNIKKFHSIQKPSTIKIETMPGVMCWRKPTPIERVGLYIPGGSAPLFSTVLMLAVPAKLAGCQEIILTSPPNQFGKIHPAILYAANYIGVKHIYKIGGIQAIAAMAFGTESIKKVNKIFGPGNQYVTKAKQLVSNLGTAIDIPAGPSELLVVADKSANAKHIAADLLSQAEHGGDSQVVLVVSSETYANSVVAEIHKYLATFDEKAKIHESIKNSRVIVLKYLEDQIKFVNMYAPEHLIINTSDCNSVVNKIVNAGSIFLGPYTPESAGDYASGTNHTLPTSGGAKAYSGVSIDSFIKNITIQKLSKKGLEGLQSTIETMAEAEKLPMHATAVSVRLEKK